MINQGETTISGERQLFSPARITVGGMFKHYLRVLVQEDRQPGTHWDNCRAQIYLDEDMAHELYEVLGSYLNK